jgi:hypothetical protein
MRLETERLEERARQAKAHQTLAASGTSKQGPSNKTAARLETGRLNRKAFIREHVLRGFYEHMHRIYNEPQDDEQKALTLRIYMTSFDVERADLPKHIQDFLIRIEENERV